MPNLMKTCCNITNKSKKCKRKDGKIFKLPRKFSKTICLSSKIKGFSMKSSCAPFKSCKKKSQFLYHPDNPDKSYDVYIDKDPSDTIPIKYTTLTDVKKTIKKLEQLYKSNKYTHKRIWQVGMILYVRLKVLKNKKKEHFKLAEKYFKFLKSRTKVKTFKKRKVLKFVINSKKNILKNI